MSRTARGLAPAAPLTLWGEQLWIIVAAVLASRRGVTRRAAVRGLVAVCGARFTAAVVRTLLRARRRPPAEPLVDRGRPGRTACSLSPFAQAAARAAFSTALAMESRRLGLAAGTIAAAVAYPRMRRATYRPEVVAGALLGASVALATGHWWPVRRGDEALARSVRDAPVLADGEGLVVLVNPHSGDPHYDPTDDIARALPAATVFRADPKDELGEQLLAAATAPGTRAVGAAGGDGTTAAAASIAQHLGLPLAVVPAGTLNHFARDLGVYDLQEVIDATGNGEAVAVTVAVLAVHPDEASHSDGHSHRDAHRRGFLNTASLGGYPDMVRLRQAHQDRWGKWLAAGWALLCVLRRAQPLQLRIDERRCAVWMLFVGNGPYHPHGMLPGFRPRLDSGLLDVRYLRADRRFSRTRAVLALLTGTLACSRTYVQTEVPTLDVELLGPPVALATDGEVIHPARRFSFRTADQPISVYRRHEENWPGRPRPYHSG